MLLPTHPLRLAWVSAHDQLLRAWADEVAVAGKTKAGARPAHRHRHGGPALASQPAVHHGRRRWQSFVYAEELTYGAALYLPVAISNRSPSPMSSAGHRRGPRQRGPRRHRRGAGDRIPQLPECPSGHRDAADHGHQSRLGRRRPQALTPLVLSQRSPAMTTRLPDPQRVEIIAYSNRLSYTDPVADLRHSSGGLGRGAARRDAPDSPAWPRRAGHRPDDRD